MEGIMHCSANYFPLTPISFLERSAKVHGDDTSVIYGSMKYTWSQTYERCRRLASALSQLGVSRRDVVAVLAPNSLAVYELLYAVPMAGGVIAAITTNADELQLADYLARAKPKLIFVDYEYLRIATAAISLITTDPPRLIPIFEPDHPSDDTHYESLILSGTPDSDVLWPLDELDPMSISFTSGTTDRPKGVIHAHRAAYLNTLATILLMDMRSSPVFLFTMPMYHCNGWCFVWATAALGGTSVIFRSVTADAIFTSIATHNATHLAGTAPVLNMIVNATEAEKRPLPGKVHVLMGGSPVPPQVLFEMEAMGFEVTHAYGQTETYCCAAYCHWKPEWNALPPETRANLKARQGVLHHLLADVDVKDPVTMESVPWDGETVGEVVYKGNNIMRGYLDPEMTKKAFRGGWFHSGDMAVRHEDGYIEMKDRRVDTVISGGKVVGTIEVESLIYGHPAVLEAGVVGMDDGDTSSFLVAFVNLKEGMRATEEEILGFCRERLPEYKVPRTVVFDVMPMTATGKLRKAVLREMAKALA